MKSGEPDDVYSYQTVAFHLQVDMETFGGSGVARRPMRGRGRGRGNGRGRGGRGRGGEQSQAVVVS